jgi:UDP-glucose 4-epimerase
MKWLITGGCGFLGAALVARLHRLGGHDVRVVDNLSTGTRADLARACEFTELDARGTLVEPRNTELVVADILEEHTARAVTAGCEIIVHLAANTGVQPSVIDPRADCLANVIGTLNYLEAARVGGVRRFVFASSGAPVGEVAPPIHEEVVPHPVSPYGASKLAGEGYCSAYYRTFGVETVALRFGNVFGPGSVHKGSVVAKFIRSALKGDTLEIYGDGGQTRDFIFIDDLIDALVLAALAEGVAGETFQIASGRETTIDELVACLLRVLHAAGIHNVRLQNSESRAGDVRRNFSDTSKARARLGWQAATTLEDGLQRTVAYFLKGQAV